MVCGAVDAPKPVAFELVLLIGVRSGSSSEARDSTDLCVGENEKLRKWLPRLLGGNRHSSSIIASSREPSIGDVFGEMSSWSSMSELPRYP